MTGIPNSTAPDHPDCWPALPLASWKDTLATLHMWTQIVGKVRMELTPASNHWWHVPLYVSARGLTTSIIPYGKSGFEMEFDFLAHQLVVRTTDSRSKTIALAPRSVSDFYRETMSTLRGLGIEVEIWTMPVEIPNPIPFDQDTVHASYDAAAAQKLWRILVSADAVLKMFRSRFIGKSSPVHFFWGGFDLAVTRFSGRRAPERNDPDPVLRKIMREAYSHEVISAGWWPGTDELAGSAFYSYAAPTPEGFAAQPVRPPAAFYHQQLGEFVLNYDDVRGAKSPTALLLEFFQSVYEAGVTTGKWERAALERP